MSDEEFKRLVGELVYDCSHLIGGVCAKTNYFKEEKVKNKKTEKLSYR